MTLEDPLKLHQWFVVEGDHGHVGHLDLSFFEGPSDCIDGKPLVVLFPRECLFTRGSDGHAVLQKAGGGVVIEAAET